MRVLGVLTSEFLLLSVLSKRGARVKSISTLMSNDSKAMARLMSVIHRLFRIVTENSC